MENKMQDKETKDEDGAKQFDNNSPNGKLMVAVCRDVMIEELSKAREEGFKNGMENAWGMINDILDTLDVDKNEEEINILIGILKVLDTEIIKLSKLTTK